MVPENDITLYEKWNEICKITYYLNGGVNSEKTQGSPFRNTDIYNEPVN